MRPGPLQAAISLTLRRIFAGAINKEALVAGVFTREEALFRHTYSLALESAKQYLHRATADH